MLSSLERGRKDGETIRLNAWSSRSCVSLLSLGVFLSWRPQGNTGGILNRQHFRLRLFSNRLILAAHCIKRLSLGKIMISLLILLILIGVFLTGVSVIYVIRESITDCPLELFLLILKPRYIFTFVIDYIGEEYSDSKTVRNTYFAGLGLIIIPALILVTVNIFAQPRSITRQINCESTDMNVEADSSGYDVERAEPRRE